MSRLRQLPKLYLRGSLANVTMKGLKKLSAKEKAEIDTIVKRIAGCDELIPHKLQFINQLSNTIGGDYRDDKGLAGRIGNAEQEYSIVIWKATVFLLHHREYMYECRGCHSDHYTSARGKPVKFDRRYPICPNCKHVRISDPGDTGLADNAIIHYEDYVVHSHIAQTRSTVPPTIKSAIKATEGPKKISNPHEIIEDPIQRKKYYGEHIWGYFRQIIKENEIRQNRTTNMISLRADQLAVEELTGLLDDHKVARVAYKGGPEGGLYRITTNPLASPLEFSLDLGKLVAKYNKAGVEIIIDYRAIYVRETPDAPLMRSSIKSSTPITVFTSASSVTPSESETSYIDIVPDGEENPEKSYDSHEAMSRIKDLLPCQGSKSFFEIITGTGDTWLVYSTEHGDKSPKLAHITRFLGVNQKQINAWKGQIKVLIHDFGLLKNR